MNIRIIIETDNAAFEEAGAEVETARILRKLADCIENGGIGDFNLKDINGNTVGQMDVEGN